MPTFKKVTEENETGVKITSKLEDNSDVCWMYHKDMKKGKIVNIELVEDLEKDGWVDSPAKLSKSDEPSKPDKNKKK